MCTRPLTCQQPLDLPLHLEHAVVLRDEASLVAREPAADLGEADVSLRRRRGGGVGGTYGVSGRTGGRAGGVRWMAGEGGERGALKLCIFAHRRADTCLWWAPPACHLEYYVKAIDKGEEAPHK